MVFFLHRLEVQGEGWDIIKHVEPRRICAPVPSQEPLAFFSLVWFLILVYIYILELSMASIYIELIHILVEELAEAHIRVRDFLVVLMTHW